MFEGKILDSITKVSEVVRFNPAGCLRMRFNKNGCSACKDACPRGAITIDRGIIVNKEACTECMVCISECPSDGLRADRQKFHSALRGLREVESPVLGCSEKPESPAHARTSCLGFLSEEHIITLALSLEGPLQINLTECAACRNGFIAGVLRERLERCSAMASLEITKKILLIGDVKDLCFRDVCYDRRGFFSALRSGAFRGMAGMMDSSSDGPGARSFSEKDLPPRRVLLNRAFLMLDEGSRNDFLARYYFELSIGDGCDHCHACAAICPSGALKTGDDDGGTGLLFNSSLCSGCGLCAEFCENGSVRVLRGISGGDPFTFAVKTRPPVNIEDGNSWSDIEGEED